MRPVRPVPRRQSRREAERQMARNLEYIGRHMPDQLPLAALTLMPDLAMLDPRREHVDAVIEACEDRLHHDQAWTPAPPIEPIQWPTHEWPAAEWVLFGLLLVFTSPFWAQILEWLFG